MDCPRRRELALASALLVIALSPLGAQVLAPRGSAAAGPDGGLPLQPARWARFTTNKVTWMSLDVSPDGQSIVFDMLGDLYTLPITGGKATRLTSGLPHDFRSALQPRRKARRLCLRPQWRRQRLDHVAGWQGHGAARPRGSAASSSLRRGRPTANTSRSPARPRSRDLAKIWLYNVRGGTGLKMVGRPGRHPDDGSRLRQR